MIEQDFQKMPIYSELVARSRVDNPHESEDFHHYNACSELSQRMIDDLTDLKSGFDDLAADVSNEIPDADADCEPDDVEPFDSSYFGVDLTRFRGRLRGYVYAGDCEI